MSNKLENTEDAITQFAKTKADGLHCCCLADEPSHESLIADLCRFWLESTQLAAFIEKEMPR